MECIRRPFKVLKGKLERLPLVQRFRKRKAELYEYLAECLEQYWFYLQMEVRDDPHCTGRFVYSISVLLPAVLLSGVLMYRILPFVPEAEIVLFALFFVLILVFCLASVLCKKFHLLMLTLFPDLTLQVFKFSFYRIILLYSVMNTLKENMTQLSEFAGCFLEKSRDGAEKYSSQMKEKLDWVKQMKLGWDSNYLPDFLKAEMTFDDHLEHHHDPTVISKLKAKFLELMLSKLDPLCYFELAWNFFGLISFLNLILTKICSLISFKDGKKDLGNHKRYSILNPFVLQIVFQSIAVGMSYFMFYVMDSWKTAHHENPIHLNSTYGAGLNVKGNMVTEAVASAFVSPFQTNATLQSEIETMQCFEEIILPSIFKILVVLIISCSGMIIMYTEKKLNQRELTVFERAAYLIDISFGSFKTVSSNPIVRRDVV